LNDIYFRSTILNFIHAYNLSLTLLYNSWFFLYFVHRNLFLSISHDISKRAILRLLTNFIRFWLSRFKISLNILHRLRRLLFGIKFKRIIHVEYSCFERRLNLRLFFLLLPFILSLHISLSAVTILYLRSLHYVILFFAILTWISWPVRTNRISIILFGWFIWYRRSSQGWLFWSLLPRFFRIARTNWLIVIFLVFLRFFKRIWWSEGTLFFAKFVLMAFVFTIFSIIFWILRKDFVEDWWRFQ